jgi:hypothetical protein
MSRWHQLNHHCLNDTCCITLVFACNYINSGIRAVEPELLVLLYIIIINVSIVTIIAVRLLCLCSVCYLNVTDRIYTVLCL